MRDGTPHVSDKGANRRKISLHANLAAGRKMRSRIDLDDQLVAEAMRATGLSTVKATIEEALRQLFRRARQRQATNDPNVDWGLERDGK